MNIKVHVQDTDFLIGMNKFKKANTEAVRNTLNKSVAMTRNNAIGEIKKLVTPYRAASTAEDKK